MYGFGTTRFGAPTDGFGSLVYLDTYNSVYGQGWRRENSFVTHNPTGVFCYGFYSFDPTKGGYKHPPGVDGEARPRHGREVPPARERPGRDAERRRDRRRASSVRQGECRRRDAPGSSRRRSCSPGATGSARPVSPSGSRRSPPRSRSSRPSPARRRPVVTVTQTVSGLNDVVAGGFEPPDVTVAAGPGFVVEMVNLAESVWRTGGGTPQLVQTRDLAVLFGSGSDRLTDPRILFDATSGRWFASISDVDSEDVLLAVSTGADPTGTWTVSSFDASGCADQPRLGIADDIVVADRRPLRGLRRARRAGARQRDLDREQGAAARRLDGARVLALRADARLLELRAGAVAVVDRDRVRRLGRRPRLARRAPARRRRRAAGAGDRAGDRDAGDQPARAAATPRAQPQTGGIRPPIATNDNRSSTPSGRTGSSGSRRTRAACPRATRSFARARGSSSSRPRRAR